MAWHYSKKIRATFIHHTTQYAYANVEGIGWRRIKAGAADGCTNLVVLMNAARANNRLVHVDIDAGNLITTAYLL